MLIGFRDGVELPFGLPNFPRASELADMGIYSYHLFPNTSIVYGGARCFLFLITTWPLAPNRTCFDVRFLAATPADGEYAGLIDAVIEANWKVFLEDLSMLPFLQRSIESGAMEALRLGYQERRIYHQHEEIDRRIGVNEVPGSLRVPPVLDAWIER
jgi:hypothetical protein